MAYTHTPSWFVFYLTYEPSRNHSIFFELHLALRNAENTNARTNERARSLPPPLDWPTFW